MATATMVGRLNVLVIVNSLVFGGAEKHAISVVNNLDPGHFGLSLAYLKPVEHLLSQVDPQHCGNGIFCCHVSRKVDWIVVRDLAKHIDEHKVDIVMCVNPYSLLYGWLARLVARRKPSIVEVFHSTTLGTFKEKLQMLFYRPFFRASDLLIYVCENQRRHWQNKGLRAKRDMVIHNGIDVDRFTDAWTLEEKSSLRQDYGFRPKDYVVGLCAEMRPEKAHDDLLNAVARLRKQNVDVKCLLIGDGTQRSQIERTVTALGLDGQVKITGFLSDVRRAISVCDVMVLASHYVETFSIAALEAMALGKPMIMTNIGGAGEQVADGINGFLYSPGDIDTLTQRLRHLSNMDNRLAMGRAARRMVVDRFSVEKMITQFSAVFDGLAVASKSGHLP